MLFFINLHNLFCSRRHQNKDNPLSDQGVFLLDLAFPTQVCHRHR